MVSSGGEVVRTGEEAWLLFIPGFKFPLKCHPTGIYDTCYDTTGIYCHTVVPYP